MSCSACDALPAQLTANTGREQSLPSEAAALERMELGRDLDLRRCKVCRALFVWGDHPQFYGSGNLDEETLDRLSPEQSQTVELLLAGALGPEVNTLVSAAFTQVSEALLMLLLSRLQTTRPDQYERVIPQLVTRLLPEPNLRLSGLLQGFARKDPRCAALVSELLRRHAPLQSWTKYLFEQCEALHP